ncbi:hypothetical protein C8J56DRAFT_1058650 [Mycena floridula]|nr:hypothetical protein C8J56DRAFT_1058650 [Mycena floridula]
MAKKPRKKSTTKASSNPGGLKIKIHLPKAEESADNAGEPVPAEAEASVTRKAVKKKGKKDPTGEKGNKKVKAETEAHNALWTSDDIHCMLQQLALHKAEAGDGGNFKASTFTKVAVEVEKVRTVGAKKTQKVCQDKFTQLKLVYSKIVALQGVSGWTWTNEGGCNIDETSAASWNEYTAKHQGVERFQNAGWEFLEGMGNLVAAWPRGTNVLDVILQLDQEVSVDTQDVSHNAVSSPSVGQFSQDWDLEKLDQDFASSDTAAPAFGTASQAAYENAETDDEDVKPVLKTPVSRKHVAAQPAPSIKRARVSTSAPASAIMNVADSITCFGDTIGSALASNAKNIPDDTPKRANKAIERAQLNEADWLTQDQMLQLFDVFKTSKPAVTTYCSLDAANTDLVRTWIKRKLQM